MLFALPTSGRWDVAGAGRGPFFSPPGEENKPITAFRLTLLHLMNPTLQPPRGMGRRRWRRNERLLGERAAFFRFQGSRRVGRVLGIGRASD